jgi:hypothetical protein
MYPQEALPKVKLTGSARVNLKNYKSDYSLGLNLTLG